MANIIKEYDKQEYFKQYVWALENVDLYQAFKDFLSKELALKNNEEAAKAAYEKFIKESNSNYIPKIGLDFMNYVMKYQNSSYEVGDTIVELDEPSSDKKTFNLYEPGYYFVELYGPSGRCLGQNINQYIPNVGENYKTFFNGTVAGESEILLRINREFKFNLQFKKLNKYQIIKGYIEANDNYVFFYECDHGLKDKLFDNKDSLQESLDTFIEGENVGGTIFDFGKFETNPLKENFYTIHLNKNNLDLRMVNYGSTEKYICGELYKKFCDAFGGEEAVNELLEKEEDAFSQEEIAIIKNIFNEHTGKHFVKGSDYYVIKIFKNMCQLNCKCLTFNSILVNDNEDMLPPSIFNENALHGGDGGYIGAVIYLDKSDTISYNVGKYDATNGEDCTTYLRSEENKFEIFAEKGGDATANEYAFYLKNQNIDNIGERPSNSSIFEDISSKDFSKKLNFHIGENYNFKEENDKGCGFGSFCKFNDEENGLISLHHFIGGGQEGEGIRLNEFDVAYYQKPKNGKIKITYLGTKYSKKKPLSISVVNNDNIKVMSSLYIGDGFVPISANIHNKLGIYGDVIGGFDVSLNGEEPENNKLIKNKSRKLNYIDFDIDYLTLDKLKDDKNNALTFDLNSKRKYIKLYNDKDNFTIVNDDNENLDTDAYFDSLHDPLIGFEGDNREYSFMMKKSVTFNDYLNTAYNNGPTFSIRDFNTSSYKLDYMVSGINKNVKIFNVFEDLIVVSFVYANTLDLPSYNDHLGNPIYKPLPNAGIKKLEYFVYDRDTSPIEYIEKTNIYLPKNAKMALKFSFNTSRIRLDESLTSLVGYNKFYKKNVSLDNETILDSYYNHDVGPDFQFVEFEPDVSQKCQVFIKKNTYSIKILPDLYYQLTPNLVFNKTEYEVGEYASISINLKNYERISNLRINRNDKEVDMNYKYVPEEESKFESYFRFSEIQNKCYNIVDNYIASFLNRQKAVKDPKDDDGLFVVSNRNINDSIYNEDKDFVKEYCFNKICCVPTEDSVLKDENVIIYIYMKDSDIELRFTDNYCPGQDLTILEQGESEYVSFFKTYNFLLKACGGITGNGENGSDQKTTYHVYTSNNGTCGGDGYVGGEGGSGGDAVHWDLGVRTWKIKVSRWTVFRAWKGLTIEGPSGGAGGIGGRGFIKSGSSGLNGTHIMGAKYASYYNDAYRLPTDAMKSFKERRDAMLNTCDSSSFLNILSNRNLMLSDYDEIFYNEFNTRGIFYSIYEKLSSSISKDYELAKSYVRKEYSKHKPYFYRVYEFHGYYYFIINGQARQFVQTGRRKIAETNEYVTSGYIGGNLGLVHWEAVKGHDNYGNAIKGTVWGYPPTNLESTNPYLDCNSNNHCLDEDTNRLIELKIHLFRLQQEYNKLMKNSYKDYLHPTYQEVQVQSWWCPVYKTIAVYDKTAGDDNIWVPYILKQKDNIRKNDSYIDLIIREDYITKYMKEWLESHKSFIKNSLTLDVDSMIKCDKTNYRSEIINRILHTIIEKAYIKLYKRSFPSSALRVPYYVGIPFVEKVKINVQNAKEGNNLIYLKSGNNGYSFSGNALAEFAGKGGGQGLPSFIKILSKDMSINILNDSNFKSKFRKLYDQSFGMSKTTNGGIKNLIFEGGIIGATRTQKAECDTYSSLWGWTAFHTSLDPKPKERNCDPNNIQKYRNEYEWLNLQTVNLYENTKFNCYDSLEQYSMLMLTPNYDKKLFDERYFSSVGYDLFNNSDIIKNDIKKFNGFSDFDKNYKVNEFKDNTYILYNCRKNLLNNSKGELDTARNTYEAEDKLVDEYTLSLNFKGKTLKSYETGIINLTVFNEDDIKKDANSFITGQVEKAEKITNEFFSDYNNVSKT